MLPFFDDDCLWAESECLLCCFHQAGGVEQLACLSIVEEHDVCFLDDLEYVFNRKYGGTEAAVVVRALLPVLSDRIRILSPGRTLRVDLGESRVSEALEASSEVDGQ